MTPSAASPKWTTLPYHRGWLLDQANGLFDFFERESIDPAGGFHDLDDTGRPILRDGSGKAPARQIHATTRMVHCFAIAG
jgi:mannose/cellobiose epimerase-like protein (N-acyl-D-glucosamine 2-epimerase family)